MLIEEVTITGLFEDIMIICRGFYAVLFFSSLTKKLVSSRREVIIRYSGNGDSNSRFVENGGRRGWGYK